MLWPFIHYPAGDAPSRECAVHAPSLDAARGKLARALDVPAWTLRPLGPGPAPPETVKVSAFHSLRGTVPFSCNRARCRPSEHYGSADAKESRSRANAAKPCSMTGKHGSQSNITH